MFDDYTSNDVINYNDFRNAPEYSIVLSDPGTATHIQGLTVSNNTFENQYFSGVLVTGVGPNTSTPFIPVRYQGSTDAYWNYNYCPTSTQLVGVPTGTVFLGNTFTGALGSAVALNESLGTQLSNNTFHNNYYANGSPLATGGGSALFMSPCNISTLIANNRIDAPDVGSSQVSGLELDGQNIHINNNQIQNLGGSGIYLA